jgi:CRISPR/Cas system-associated exonuclease Cas4 (RecB family)
MTTHSSGEFDEIYDRLKGGKASRRLSPSALNTLLQCPRLYWFKYIMGWKISSSGVALALGSAVHGGFEKLNRNIALGKKVHLNDIFEEFDTFWEKESEGLVLGEHYKKEKELEDNYNMGLGITEKYWNSIRRKQMSPITYQPPGASVDIPAVEMRIEVPFIDLFTDKIIDDDWMIIGYIDVIKQVKRASKGLKVGDLAVLDYKTTQREFDDFKLTTLVQLLIYAYAMRFMLRNYNMFPGMKKDREDFVGIIECLKRKTPKNIHAKTKLISVSDEQIEQLQLLIRDAIALIRNGIFLPYFGDHCGWCDFKEPCSGMTRGEDPREWWSNNGARLSKRSNRVTVS